MEQHNYTIEAIAERGEIYLYGSSLLVHVAQGRPTSGWMITKWNRRAASLRLEMVVERFK